MAEIYASCTCSGQVSRGVYCLHRQILCTANACVSNRQLLSKTCTARPDAACCGCYFFLGQSCFALASQERPALTLTQARHHFAGGFLTGIVYGFCTQLLLKWMRRLGATTDQQIALTFACAYLSFYTANGPIGVSGDHVVRQTAAS